MGVLVCELVCSFLTWTAYVKTPETQKDKGDKKDISGSVNNSTSVTWPVVRGNDTVTEAG